MPISFLLSRTPLCLHRQRRLKLHEQNCIKWWMHICFFLPFVRFVCTFRLLAPSHTSTAKKSRQNEHPFDRVIHYNCHAARSLSCIVCQNESQPLELFILRILLANTLFVVDTFFALNRECLCIRKVFFCVVFISLLSVCVCVCKYNQSTYIWIRTKLNAVANDGEKFFHQHAQVIVSCLFHRFKQLCYC